MCRKIMLSFLVLNLAFVFADEHIKASVKYNEVSARVEAFKDVENKIKKDFYRQYLKDRNYKENKELLKNNVFEVENNRYLCPFYYKKNLIAYAVVYEENLNYTFYYNILGSLVKFDIQKDSDYPVKIYGYSKFGNLISVVFALSENEQFVYDENGKLIARWFDKNMTDKNDKIPKVFKLTRGHQD